MNADDIKLLARMVVDIRETENLLLARSRSNLEVLKGILESGNDIKQVPAVLSTFSIAGIIAGLFINAGINHGRLLAYHVETLSIQLKQVSEEAPDTIQALAELKHEEAGLLFPWLDNRMAEIQTQLERFQEVQVRGISPHLSFINKITTVTRALSESADGMASALRAYVADERERLFIWAVVEELVACIDNYPDSLDNLRFVQDEAEDKMTSVMEEIQAFVDERELPQTALLLPIPEKRQAGRGEKLTASIASYIDNLDHLRASTLRFDKSLQLMAKTLPPFIKTLSTLTTAWNKEASV